MDKTWSDWFDNLKVGDKVYFENRNVRGIYTIERMTDTQILLPHNIKISRKTGHQIMSDSYNAGYIKPVTPELVEDIRQSNRLNFVSHKVVWSDLSPETVKQVYDIVKLALDNKSAS